MAESLLEVQQLPTLLEGASVTFKASILAECVALGIGLGITILREIRLSVLQVVIRVYTSFTRGTPSLIQIFIVYYVFPTLFGVSMEPFQAGCLAVGLNSAAFVSEVLRGGLAAIPQGQIEAARAVGMSTAMVWQRIILPQVFMLTLPGLVSEFVIVIQDSSLLSVISVVELTRKSEELVGTIQKPLEIYGFTGVIYFTFCFGISMLARSLYKRKMIAYRT